MVNERFSLYESLDFVIGAPEHVHQRLLVCREAVAQSVHFVLYGTGIKELKL